MSEVRKQCTSTVLGVRCWAHEGHLSQHHGSNPGDKEHIRWDSEDDPTFTPPVLTFEPAYTSVSWPLNRYETQVLGDMLGMTEEALGNEA